MTADRNTPRTTALEHTETHDGPQLGSRQKHKADSTVEALQKNKADHFVAGNYSFVHTPFSPHPASLPTMLTCCRPSCLSRPFLLPIAVVPAEIVLLVRNSRGLHNSVDIPCSLSASLSNSQRLLCAKLASPPEGLTLCRESA